MHRLPISLIRLSRLLYPTLIAACYQMEDNKAILEEEISCKLLVAFLQEACGEEGKHGGDEPRDKKSSTIDLSSMLKHRFPKSHWEEAITYFS